MENVLDELVARYEKLTHLKEPIGTAAKMLISAYRNHKKMLVCGNGGSSSDAGHIVGELMKSFEAPRTLDPAIQQNLRDSFGMQGKQLAENLQQGLPAISLCEHSALLTAISNDLGGEFIFAQQVVGYGNSDDILLALSTSGNSRNVLNALMTARAKGMKTIGMTGENGGQMKALCDVVINVPATRTAHVQELHLPVYHALCMMVEKALFD